VAGSVQIEEMKEEKICFSPSNQVGCGGRGEIVEMEIAQTLEQRSVANAHMEHKQRAAAGEQQTGKVLPSAGGFDFRDYIAIAGASGGRPEECGRSQTRLSCDVVQRRNP
jgi:hypothetical protein